MIGTENLILRPIEKSDTDRMYEVYSNPTVMKYIYDGSTFTREKIIKRVEECLLHWEKYGFGCFVMIEKTTKKTVGYCVLRYFDDDHPDLNGKIEIGYTLDEPFWGKGYATEAVNALIKFGFDQCHFNRILATILPDNIASQKVVKKAGMVYIGDLETHGLVHQIYEKTP